MTYTRLDNVIDELRGDNAYAGAKSNEQIMRYIRTVTKRIGGFGWDFEPWYGAHKITPTRTNVNSSYATLALDDDLLEVISITVGGAAITWGTDIIASPDGVSPIRVLQIPDPVSGALHSWYGDCSANGYLNSIVITGFWGMRSDYSAEGFFVSGQVTPGMNATQTTFIVADVDGADIYYRTPLFSPGNLIRIENELLAITAVDTTTNTLTVQRGANGSTAAAHLVALPILIWQPEQDIEMIATRQSCLLYARRGSYQEVSTYPDGTNVTFPSDLLAEVRACVQRFNYA
jgi:hypothetical protein